MLFIDLFKINYKFTEEKNQEIKHNPRFNQKKSFFWLKYNQKTRYIS
jgi:hypothetical protein